MHITRRDCPNVTQTVCAKRCMYPQDSRCRIGVHGQVRENTEIHIMKDESSQPMNKQTNKQTHIYTHTHIDTYSRRDGRSEKQAYIHTYIHTHTHT
jgi:hypothetical protein